MVDGLAGKGKLAARSPISTKALADYVISRVEELAKERKAEQEPQPSGEDAQDCVLTHWLQSRPRRGLPPLPLLRTCHCDSSSQ
jgi:hypothetical protein